MIGKTVSHYKITEKLGQGGMGVVYRAEDTKLKRTVALKFLPSDMTSDPQTVERLVHEARAAAALDHPNICTIYEIGEDESHTYIAMAHVEGKTLTDTLARGPLDVNRVLGIVAQVAEGLREAHEKGIVHRDIKPANIMITARGRAKIMDFGLAKLAGTADLTGDTYTAGTIAYMSPEQARGEEVDRRTDIWSLGVVLYEMLTGRRPFSGDYEQAVVYSILNEEPAAPSALRPDLPAEIDRIVPKVLSKDPPDRYQSIDGLIDDLRPLLSEVAPGSSLDESGQARPQPSIAVLPFTNMSADPEQEYFCDGMAEEIISALAQLDGLRVVARTSAFAFKDEKLDIREVGTKLNVTAVLEGSVRKSGNRLRIAAQLVSVEDGYHMWSERYDREVEDVFAIQDEIALAIVDKLKVQLLGKEKAALARKRPESVEAYNLYLKGRYHWNKRTPDEARRAMEYFRRAVQKDPDYAPAYSGIADVYLILENVAAISPDEAFSEARAAVAKALEIDDSLAEAHASLGWIKMVGDWDWDGGGEELRRAIELNPGYATARQWYAVYLTVTGRREEALVEAGRAQETDPLSLMICVLVGNILQTLGRQDEAIEQYEKAVEMDAGFVIARLALADASYLDRKMYDATLAEIEKATALPGGEYLGRPMLGYTYAKMGKRNEALEVLEDLKDPATRGGVNPVPVAVIYAALGEKELALDWLEKAAEVRSSRLMVVATGDALDSLRSEPRFIALLEKMGLKR
jgi:TolB-like protein